MLPFPCVLFNFHTLAPHTPYPLHPSPSPWGTGYATNVFSRVELGTLGLGSFPRAHRPCRDPGHRCDSGGHAGSRGSHRAASSWTLHSQPRALARGKGHPSVLSGWFGDGWELIHILALGPHSEVGSLLIRLGALWGPGNGVMSCVQGWPSSGQ